MIELYIGDGKGKTTASVGLAVRAAGGGVPVLFVQFLKSGTSGELKILRSLPGTEVLLPEVFYGFVSRMSDEQKQSLKLGYTELLGEIERKVRAFSGLPDRKDGAVRAVVILDEAIHAVRHGFLPEERVLELFSSIPSDIEVVMTGRGPSEKLLEKADYVSEIRPLKHPFADGVRARRGIEF